MDAGDIIEAAGVAIAVLGSFIAIGNARSARKQADLAEETADAAIMQADSAEKQAVEAKRSADAAWEQLRGANLDRLHTAFYRFLTASGEHLQAVRIAVSAMDLEGREVNPDLLFAVVESDVARHPAKGVLLGGLPPDSAIHNLVKKCASQSTRCVQSSMSVPLQRMDPRKREEEIEKFQERADRAVTDFGVTVSNLQSAGTAFFEEEYRRANDGSGSPS